MYFNIRPKKLTDWLHQELVEGQKTLKEYEIISAWQKNNWLPKDCLRNSLRLFRTHFFVFHQLYHLHAKLLENSEGLIIDALQIRHTHQLSHSSQFPGLKKLDTLLHYYLDWRPLFETSEKEVQQLLSFAHTGLCNPYRLQEAFTRFNLSPPTTSIAVKQRYKKLASKHHPDKGGELDAIQRINEDKTLLLGWLEHQHI